jgi:hypothetical protein
LVIVMLVATATTATTGAIALDEQRMAIPAPGPETPKADVQEQSSPKSDEGTEIRIPGLGKLGTLPKMDFGLELLYGAAEDNTIGNKPAPDPGPENNDADQQDLMIHGSVKHRF